MLKAIYLTENLIYQIRVLKTQKPNFYKQILAILKQI